MLKQEMKSRSDSSDRIMISFAGHRRVADVAGGAGQHETGMSRGLWAAPMLLCAGFMLAACGDISRFQAGPPTAAISPAKPSRTVAQSPAAVAELVASHVPKYAGSGRRARGRSNRWKRRGSACCPHRRTRPPWGLRGVAAGPPWRARRRRPRPAPPVPGAPGRTCAARGVWRRREAGPAAASCGDSTNRWLSRGPGRGSGPVGLVADLVSIIAARRGP